MKRIPRAFLSIVTGIGMLLGSGCTAARHSAKSEMERLQGTWQLVYQQGNGRKSPDEFAAEKLRGTMVFTGDKARSAVELLPGFDLGFAYTLHPDQQPKAIDLQLIDTPDKEGLGVKWPGIYLLENDSLQICHHQTNRPTEFNAEKGSPNTLIVLRRKAGPSK